MRIARSAVWMAAAGVLVNVAAAAAAVPAAAVAGTLAAARAARLVPVAPAARSLADEQRRVSALAGRREEEGGLRATLAAARRPGVGSHAVAADVFTLVNDHVSWYDTNYQPFYMGEIHFDGSVARSFIEVTVSLRDAQGAILETESTYLFGSCLRNASANIQTGTCLRPGETGFFGTYVDVDPAQVASIAVFVEFEDDPLTDPFADIVPVGTPAAADHGGEVRVQGDVRNTGVKAARFVRVAIAVESALGELADVDTTYITGSTVGGSSAGLEIGALGTFALTTAASYAAFGGFEQRIDWQDYGEQGGSRYDAYTPAAAHTGGVNNAVWTSDVDLYSGGDGDDDEDDTAVVEVFLLKKDQANLQPASVEVTVPGGKTVRLTDLLGTQLKATNAALAYRFVAGRVAVNSRFINTPPGGGGGQFGMLVPTMTDEQALTAANTALFHHLSYSPDGKAGFRVNIGFVNTVPFEVEVRIELFDADGALLGTHTRTLLPFEHRQLTNIHGLVGTPAVAHGHAKVTVETEGGKVHPYAMLINNVSGDPVYMPATLM